MRAAVPDADTVIRRPGAELEPRLRHSFGRQFGADFSTVRVHADPTAAASALRLGAAAYTVGNHIVFGSCSAPHTAVGQRLLAHELVHVVQLGGHEAGGTATVSRPSDAVEVDAARAAETALTSGQTLRIRQASAPGLLRQAVADPFDALRTPQKKLTTAEAKAMLDHYETLPDAARDTVVRAFHHVGVIDSDLARWLAALDVTEVTKRRKLISDIAQRVQRLTVEQLTGHTLTQLGAAQGAFMKQTDTRHAMATASAEAAKTGQRPKAVTAADIAREHKQETKRNSPVGEPDVDAWDALAKVPGAQEKWNARAAAVITAVVDACREQVPELGIVAANLKWDPHQVLADAGNVFALTGDPIIFGMSFVETAEADPGYVVSTVVHEIRGHPDFGTRLGSYEAQIYTEAHRQDPTLGRPWTPAELHTYGYIGTETYAALREIPYERWSNAALAAGLRLEVPVANKATFVRLGLQSQLHARLFGKLYADLRGGYLWGISGGASSGVTVGGGVSYNLGHVELGLVYDYLKAADAKDPDAHRAFLSIGLRL